MREMLRAQTKRLTALGVLLAFCGGSLALYYYASHEYAVRGEVFRVTKEGPQMVSGAKIHVFRIDLPKKYAAWLNPTQPLLEGSEVAQRSSTSKRSLDDSNPCSGVFDALDRQFADSSDHIELQFIYRPLKASAWDEWHEIESDPDFKALSRSQKVAARRVFWDRRIAFRPDWLLKSENTQHELYRTFFRDELAQGKAPPSFLFEWSGDDYLDFLKRLSQEQIVTAQTAADSHGQFSVMLKRGRYVVTGGGQVRVEKYSYSTLSNYTTMAEAAWAVPLVVESDTRVILSDPICSP